MIEHIQHTVHRPRLAGRPLSFPKLSAVICFLEATLQSAVDPKSEHELFDWAISKFILLARNQGSYLNVPISARVKVDLRCASSLLKVAILSSLNTALIALHFRDRLLEDAKPSSRVFVMSIRTLTCAMPDCVWVRLVG